MDWTWVDPEDSVRPVEMLNRNDPLGLKARPRRKNAAIITLAGISDLGKKTGKLLFYLTVQRGVS
jgi:hypothetical protein